MQVREPIQTGDPTIKHSLTYMLWVLFLGVASLQTINETGSFGDRFASFFASLIWLLLLGHFCSCASYSLGRACAKILRESSNRSPH